MKTAPCAFHVEMLLVVSLSVTSRALDISIPTTIAIFTQCLVYERKIIFCREPDLLEGFMLVLWESLKVLEIWPRKYRKVMFYFQQIECLISVFWFRFFPLPCIGPCWFVYKSAYLCWSLNCCLCKGMGSQLRKYTRFNTFNPAVFLNKQKQACGYGCDFLFELCLQISNLMHQSICLFSIY